MIRLIVTIKNRLSHFLQTFPFMISQYGKMYELVVLDYHSNDHFEEEFRKEIKARQETFSPYLNKIIYIKLFEDLKFNLKKARNLATSYFDSQSSIFAFSDADVFLGMTYLTHWSEKVNKNKTFVATRSQDTRASYPCRIKPEVNAGNFLVSSEDFFKVQGHDENMSRYGGGDDDLFHRLKLSGLREINPYNENEARQYSIIHDDELRLRDLEIPERVKKEEAFENIYANKDCVLKENKFIKRDYSSNISTMEVLYENNT
jgi:predicted glycosyltransferase involved in capsule biosynthesis